MPSARSAATGYVQGMSDPGTESFFAAQREYRKLYEDLHGPGPYECHFASEGHCKYPDDLAVRNGGQVTALTALIHHRDHDHSNDDPDNLVASHWGCHSSHHIRDWFETATDEEKAARGRKGAEGRNARWTPKERRVWAVEMGRKHGAKAAEASNRNRTPEQRKAWAATMIERGHQRRGIEASKRSRRARMTPEHRERLEAKDQKRAELDAMTPEERAEWRRAEQSARGRQNGRVTARRRYECLVCRRSMNLGALGTHQKHSGHEGRRRLADAKAPHVG